MSTKVDQKFVAPPTTPFDVVFELFVSLAKKYFFLEVRKKAIAYVAIVTVLSILSEVVTFPEGYYSQKNNVFNQYGTKIGWFWTLLFLIPYVGFTSMINSGSVRKACQDLVRIGVASVLWYFTTNSFISFENITGRCHGAEKFSRSLCSINGGKWMPGFDISGHCFMLIYANLIMSEEAFSFRHWPSSPPLHTPGYRPSKKKYDEFKEVTKLIRLNFILLFLLNLLWDFQIIITSIYFHTVLHKVIGSLIAVFYWLITYRFWYRICFPYYPIRRHGTKLK